MLIKFNLLISFCRLFLLKLRWFAHCRLTLLLFRIFSAGNFVDLALAYSLGAGVQPDASCKFNREDGVGSRRGFYCRVSQCVGCV